MPSACAPPPWRRGILAPRLFRDVAAFALLLAAALAAPCHAAELSGLIRTPAGPAPAASLTVTENATGIRFSTFSGTDGRYAIDLPRAGAYRTEVHHGAYAARGDALLEAGTPTNLSFTLTPDPEILTALPSEAWLALLPDGAMKREFIVNCASCHEIDAARVLVDGRVRNAAQWREAFAMMRAIDQYALLPPDFDDGQYSDWLAEHFTAERVAALAPAVHGATERLRQVTITEYPLPLDNELPHDLVVGPDGRIWITAFFNDVIWALDAASGRYESFPLRDKDAEGWGQARALAFDVSGALWVVLGGTHELVRLDPGTGEIETHSIGMYAHSLVIDTRGRIWFNDYFARQERIGMFDPQTETVRHIDMPSAGLSEEEGLALPYGLQIDPDGRLFSTQLTGNTLVMFDTATEQSRLFSMPEPNSGPRRPAIGIDGRLWIPEWNTGYLTRFDPHTETFERFRVGSAGLGAYDAESDPTSGRIWVTGALASSMVLFDPRDETVLDIPLPTNPAYTRHLAVDPRNGDLWSAYSSLPAARPLVVRIEQTTH